MGNYTYELDFGNFKAENSPFIGIEQQYEISNFTYIKHDSASQNVVNIADNQNYVYISDSKVIVNSLPWTLYFNGSKSKEGAGVSCLLIEPKGNKTCIVCRLEFECTNIIAEYEACIQCLRKDLYLKPCSNLG